MANIQERLTVVHSRIDAFGRREEQSLNSAWPTYLTSIQAEIQQNYSKIRAAISTMLVLPPLDPTEMVVNLSGPEETPLRSLRK